MPTNNESKKKKKASLSRTILVSTNMALIFALFLGAYTLLTSKNSKNLRNESSYNSSSETTSEPHFFDTYSYSDIFPTSKIIKFINKELDSEIDINIPLLDAKAYYYKEHKVGETIHNFHVYALYRSEVELKNNLAAFTLNLTEIGYVNVQIYSDNPYSATFMDEKGIFYLSITEFQGLEGYVLLRLDFKVIN